MLDGVESRPIGTGHPDLLRYFFLLLPHGPSSEPNIDPSKRCRADERYTRLHGCSVTAAPISACSTCCVRQASRFLRPGSPRPSRAKAFWRSSKIRPALTAGGTQPLCRVPPIVTRPLAFLRHEARARVRTRDASAGYLDQKSTHAQRHAESCLTAVLCTQRSLAGPASVIKPTQHSWSKQTLNL
jgi:hypothetical protein